jgi:LacI family transcriptional regulator
MSNIRRVTLADIAKKAKVHVTTVSMALRNHPRLPEKTKKRIKALAKKMGYKPDPLLTALAAYRTRSKTPRFQSTIAYLTNWATEWGWKNATAHLEFFTGAEKAAHELGFKLEHFWLHAPDLNEMRLNRILRNRGIGGLILASHGREMGDTVNLDWSKFSCVKIDYFPHQPLVHNITNYQSDIVRLAMKKAMEAGYRRIGFVMHRGWDHAVDHNWMAGYLCESQQIQEEDRIPTFVYPNYHPVERWLKENTATFVPDAGEFEKWLRQNKPDVILSNSTFLAPVFKELKLKVPKDVAFIDLFLSDFSGTTAGVRQNHETVGALAVELVSGQLKHNKIGIPDFPTTTFVEGTWFDGASCPSKVAH